MNESRPTGEAGPGGLSPAPAPGVGATTVDAAPSAISELLLDRHLPEFDARQVNAVVIDAPPPETYGALRPLDTDQIAPSFPLMRLMGAARCPGRTS